MIMYIKYIEYFITKKEIFQYKIWPIGIKFYNITSILELYRNALLDNYYYFPKGHIIYIIMEYNSIIMYN